MNISINIDMNDPTAVYVKADFEHWREKKKQADRSALYM